MDNAPKRSEFARNKGVLLACFAGMMFGISAVPFYTLGIMAGPATAATGWTMQQFQGAFSFIILGTFFGPVIGHFCDRFGPRPVAILSIIAFSSSLALLGPLSNLGLYAFYAGWALMAIVGQGTSPILWTHVIGHHFSVNRGLAFGIVLAGSGVFAAIGPSIVTAVIAAFGWQAGYAFLGLVALIIPLPLILIFLKRQPAAAIKDTAAIGDKVSAEQADMAIPGNGVQMADALKNYRFYIIGIAFFIVAMGVAGLISNMIPLLSASDIAADEAARLIGLVGVAVIFGRLAIGALLDRFWGPAVAAIGLALPGIACAMLINQVTSTQAAIAVFLIGFAAGAEFDIVAFFAAKYFGLAAYGKIYGMLFVTLLIGAAIAPPIFGAVFDQTGSYVAVAKIFMFAFPAAAISLLTLGKYPAFGADISAITAPA